MNNLILAEFIKLKRLKLLFLIPVGIAFPTVLGIIQWIRIRSSYGKVIGLNYGLPLVEWEMSSWIIMMTIAFLTIWIFVSEYRNSLMDNMFSYPYARAKIMLAKLIVIFIITAFMVLAVYFFAISYGVAVMGEKADWGLLYFHFKVCLAIIALIYSVVPLCAMVCIISKNYALPVVLTFVIYILNPRFTGIAFFRILPWNVPFFIVQSVQKNLDPRFELFQIKNYVPYILSSILTFAGPMIFNLRYYRELNHR